MNKILIIFLIFIFLVIGVMVISTMQSHNDCFLNKMGNCSQDVLSMIKAHLGLFLTLSEGVLGHSLLLISLFVLAVLGLIKNFPIKKEPAFYRRNNFSFKRLASHKKPFYEWLSVHENSPSFVRARI